MDNIRESLLVLTVKNANLSAIPHSYFSGCDSLQQLILKQNRLTTIPDLLDVSDTLRFVNFDYNDITAVTPLYDLIFPVLKYVYLTQNKIHQVDIKRLHFPCLHGMDLSNNVLQVLGHPILLESHAKIPGQRDFFVDLNLVGNPWHCNDNSSWVGSSLQKVYRDPYLVYLYWVDSQVYVRNPQDMICHTPASMRGKTFR